MSKLPLLMSGASGLVGSRFVELYQDIYEIYNLDLTNQVDITSLESVRQFVTAHPATHLIHLAAFTDTTRAQAEAGDKTGLCYRVNVVGTENITRVCREQGIHLIHISTDFVFDGTKPAPYVEGDPRHPLDWYGETKAQAEAVVEQGGGDYTIVRLAYPYRREFALKPDLVTKLRSKLADNSLPPQFTDTVITPTFVDDLARGFDTCIKQSPKGIYHFVGSTSLSPYELAVKVAKTFGFDPALVKQGTLTEYLKNNPRPFARNSALSNHKAVTELGLTFADIDAGLAALT